MWRGIIVRHMTILKTKRKRVRVLIIMCSVLGLLGGGVTYYAHRNMTYDRAAEAVVRRAGFVERQVTLPSGSVIHYGEGPANGSPLMLVHGQQTTWRDYSAVLTHDA